jgi:hypothetical protein
VQPDTPDGLSPAALTVLCELEKISREDPEASGPEIAAELARRFCRARLKKRER